MNDKLFPTKLATKIYHELLSKESLIRFEILCLILFTADFDQSPRLVV